VIGERATHFPEGSAAVDEELQCDVLVAGGGINGVAIARDAAGRGLSAILCEQADLASYTSSASTKLIHGGLRYLEHGEIGLVRKALQERAVLLRAAPHLVRPLRLVLVHDDSMRPAWMLRAGLWLYDHLASHPDLPASRRVELASHPAGQALRPRFRTGFEFSDAWTDDARLVVTAAIGAAEKGARILTRTRLVRAQRQGSAWVAQAEPPGGGGLRIRARALVNATGPWAGRFLQDVCGLGSHARLRLVKGSHLVVRRTLGHAFAYVLQSADRRIAFAIPFEDAFTLIGTTDVEFGQSPESARIDADEIDYLCGLANRYLAQPIGAGDIAWTFSGIRPLLDGAADPSALTRDYSLELDGRGAPLLTVWGGKVTTFRTLAEEAVDRLGPWIGRIGERWTRDAVLPGGNLDAAFAVSGSGASALARYVAALRGEYGWMPPAVLQRMVRAYGSRVRLVLGSARRLADLGEAIGDGLYESELEYLADHEWATRADDVLWRRTKLGLHLPAEQQQRVADWLGRRVRPQRRRAGQSP
jgi:glycerol-3-phosphate dehydrogenase